MEISLENWYLDLGASISTVCLKTEEPDNNTQLSGTYPFGPNKNQIK